MTIKRAYAKCFFWYQTSHNMPNCLHSTSSFTCRDSHIYHSFFSSLSPSSFSSLSPSSFSLFPLAFHSHSLLISRTISVAAAALLLVARFFVYRIILHSSCCMQQMRQACMPQHTTHRAQYTAHPTGLTKCNIFSYAYTILIGYSLDSPRFACPKWVLASILFPF